MTLNGFAQTLERVTGTPRLTRAGLHTLQLNLGPRCNLECHHCHLGASPRRREAMEWPVMEQALDLVTSSGCTLVDLTGGAPELNPHFRRLVAALHERQVTIQLRTNLTALLEPETTGVAEFLKEHGVRLVGSLPCYLEENIERQRGSGVAATSLEALRLLNRLGYGTTPELPLDLVYNPGGPFLPGSQCQLEADYRRELATRHGVSFTSLITITNMPIGRFQGDLRRQGTDGAYRLLLRQAFNPATLERLMCRHQISIGWDGGLYDCDFNLALGLALPNPDGATPTWNPHTLLQLPVITGEHCFACTAGSGSSCQGALVA